MNSETGEQLTPESSDAVLSNPHGSSEAGRIRKKTARMLEMEESARYREIFKIQPQSKVIAKHTTSAKKKSPKPTHSSQDTTIKKILGSQANIEKPVVVKSAEMPVVMKSAEKPIIMKSGEKEQVKKVYKHKEKPPPESAAYTNYLGTDPRDVAAHLKLLGESLANIGVRLQQHQGHIAIHGSMSVLLDSLLCCLGSLMCLTRQVPQLDGCPQAVLTDTLNNIAYIMPGVG